MKTIRSAVPSSMLASVFALRAFFDDNTWWTLDFSDQHFPAEVLCRARFISFESRHSVVGEAVHTPIIQGGDNGELYPVLWRVMRLDDYERFLKKHVFEFDGVGVYRFFHDHTSPQAALHFRAFTEHSEGSDRFELERGCFRLLHPFGIQPLAAEELAGL